MQKPGMPNGVSGRCAARDRAKARALATAPSREELWAAVGSISKSRSDIAAEVGISADHLRKVLNGSRSCRPELGQQILAACGWPANVHLPLGISPQLRLFLVAFTQAAPTFLEDELGDLSELIEPRWAPGIVHRVGELLREFTQRKQHKLEELLFLGVI